MDQNTFFHQLGRHAQSSLSLGPLLVQMGLSPQKNFAEKYPELLSLTLGNLKGTFLKIGQLLSIVPDLMPPEYATAFQSLQSQAPPMGELFVRRRMRAELGDDWKNRFASFNSQPFAAASLGQVHRAQSLSGEALACKLQYPHMEATLAADLQQLAFFLKIYTQTNGAIRAEKIFHKIGEKLQQELDYIQEKNWILSFQDLFKGCPFVHIPHIFDEICTPRLLSLSFLEGQPLQSFYDAPLTEKNKIAAHLFYAWYFPFYTKGFLHSDPHFGNYSIRPDFSINLMDFGCVSTFKPTFIQGVIALYRGLLHKNKKAIHQAFELWGFEKSTFEVLEVITQWAQFLYAPLLEDKVRTLDDNGQQGKVIAKKVHQELKRLGGITPPQEFIFMDRVAVGLGSAFIHLQAELNWHQLFEKMIAESPYAAA